MTISVSGCDQTVQARTLSISIESSHPLIKLANVLSWKVLSEPVVKDLKSTTAKGFWNLGRTLLVRMHLAVFILQKIYNKTDREIAQDLQDNVAYRLFSGDGIVQKWHTPHFTKVEEFRNRLSPETQLYIANAIAKQAVDLGFADPRKVDIDSTVQEANITYPSDARLMVQLAERSMKAVSWLKEKFEDLVPKDFVFDMKKIKSKARSYFFLAKNVAKEARQKVFAELHKTIKKQVYAAQKISSKLSSEDLAKMPWNVRKSFDQVSTLGKRYLLDVAEFIRTNKMKVGKILSFHASKVACIVKGKAGKPYEFGRVFQIGRIAGNFVFTCHHTSIRMDDKSALTPMLEEHHRLFPNIEIIDLATDKGYFSKANEDAAEEALRGEGNLHLGYQYEETPDDIDTQLKDHRAGLEAVIGHIKQGGQLGKSRMKSDKATLAAGYAALLGFNLRQMMRHQARI
jgi:IS5 family transposase